MAKEDTTSSPVLSDDVFHHATAAALRALAHAPKHEVAFGRMWQSGPEHTEFPITADDTTLRGLADLEASQVRFQHSNMPTFKHSAQNELFDFLEQARRAALLGMRYEGARRNIVDLWKQDTMIDFKTLTENDPPNALLNDLVVHARRAWLDPLALPPMHPIIGKLRMTLSDPVLFADTAKQCFDDLWSMQQDLAPPAATPQAPKAISNDDSADSPLPEEGTNTSLEAERSDDTVAPSHQTPAAADSTEFLSHDEAGADGMMHDPGIDNATEESPLSRYRVYTHDYDETIHADSLLTLKEQQRLRGELETQLLPFKRLVHKLAMRLQQELQSFQPDGWQRGLDDGLLDLNRLARVRAHRHGASGQRIYKQPHLGLARDCVVTLLLDNSGSMRGRPIMMTALCADIIAHTLERCGVKVEILGYTTRQWKGGQAFKDWQKDGKPAAPGRLNELRHIIYKAADRTWRQARLSITAMLKDGVLKENIDGEALLWAHNRLIKRHEKRKILMVISDGAPVDDATLAANTPDYLEQHLHDAIHWIEQQRAVELVAIGIGHDVARYYKRATMIRDAESLGETMLNELGKLLRRKSL